MADVERPGGIAPLPAVVGVVALVIAGWGLAGGPDLGGPDVARWVAIGLAAAVGVVLIVVGRHRRER